jgi:hypothetical protein
MTRKPSGNQVDRHEDNSKPPGTDALADRSRLAKLIGRLLARHWLRANADQFSPLADRTATDRSGEGA